MGIHSRDSSFSGQYASAWAILIGGAGVAVLFLGEELQEAADVFAEAIVSVPYRLIDAAGKLASYTGGLLS